MRRSSGAPFDFARHVDVLSDKTRRSEWSQAFVEVRRQLCNAHAVPEEHLLKLANIFVRGVRCPTKPRDALQCAWALTNLSCGGSDQTKAIVQAGGVAVLGNTFKKTKNVELRDQCMWALANIACENSKICHRIRKLNLVPDLTMIISSSETSFRTLKNALWFCNRITFNWVPRRENGVVEDSGSTLVKALINVVMKSFRGRNQKDVDCIWRDSLHTLSELIELSDTLSELVLTHRSFAQYLMRECEKTTSKTFLVGCMRVFGGITNLSDELTLRLIELGVIDCLYGLLEKSPNPQSRDLCDVYWVLGNIACCEEHVSEHLFSHPKYSVFHDNVVLALRSDDNADGTMSLDASFVMLNAFLSASPERIKMLCSSGFFCIFEYIVTKKETCEFVWDSFVEAMRVGMREDLFVHCGLINEFDKMLEEATIELQRANSAFARVVKDYTAFFKQRRREKEAAWTEKFARKPKRLPLDRTRITGLVPDYDQVAVEIAFEEEGNRIVF